MSAIELALVISIPTIITIITFFIVRNIFGLFKTSVDLKKDTRIFELDLYSKKVKVVDKKHSFNYRDEEYNKHSIIRILRKKDSWVPLKEVLSNLYLNPNTETMFIKAFDSLETTGEKQEFTFSHTIHKKFFSIKIELFEKENETGHILIISYKQMFIPKDVNKKVRFITKKAVIENNSMYKGFIAFNLTELDSRGGSETINMFKAIWKGELEYFIHGKMIVVAFMSNSFRKNNARIAKLIQNITKYAPKLGGHHFYDGTSFITLRDVNTIKNLNRALSALDFLIMISIAKKKPFVTNQSKTFDINEYKEYSKAFNSFKEAVKVGSYETELIPVKSMKSNRKIINIARPWIGGIDEKIFRSIIKNNNNKTLLKDGYSKFVSVSASMKEPVFFNVNATWLIDNIDQITDFKNIFTLNVNEATDQPELLEVVEKLRKKGAIFGLKIRDLEEWIIPYLEAVQPKFIIFAKNIWDDSSIIPAYSMVKLMKIKELSERYKTKIIYENPSNLLDEPTMDRIGLNYYYNV